MALAQKLIMRQSQSLVMTPQLSQSIKLLAMSNIELSNFVEEEIERNPFLERDSRVDGVPEDARGEDPLVSRSGDEKILDVTALNELETSAQSLSENLGTSVENDFPDEQDYQKADDIRQPLSSGNETQSALAGLPMSGGTSVYDKTVADFAANNVSLRDHLLEQMTIAAASPASIIIARDVIDNLDEAGYFIGQADEMMERLGASNEQIEEALQLIQGFEPTGVGARDLKECLCLQLNEKNRLDPAMKVILDNLDLLGKRDFTALSKLAGIDVDDLQDALLEIQSLDPKPGTAFESTPIQHVAADVFVTESTDGSWKIELNNDTLPRVLVNESYSAEISTKLGNKAEKEYIVDCMQNAGWLTKSLDQRAKTILKVVTDIVKKQDAFLMHGVRHLKPLTLREVADAIDMHESTVSRVTSNKYMMTSRGLFELKYFFTTSITSSSGGEGHSAEAVRDRIRGMINQESANAVLSDDAIVDTLRTDGIDIARRTVAKYRDAMHIPSSVQRRREKRATAGNGLNSDRH